MKVFHLLAIVCAIGSANHSHATSLINGGFEIGISIPNYPDQGWRYFSETIYWDCGESHSGNCSAMLATTPSGTLPDILWQDFETTPGLAYELTFYAKTNRNTLFDTGSLTFSAPIGLVHSNPPYPAETTFATVKSWARVDYLFTATESSSRVSFKGLGFANDRIGNFIDIDDVSITLAVPEPATSALWLLGLAAVGIAAKARSRSLAAS